MPATLTPPLSTPRSKSLRNGLAVLAVAVALSAGCAGSRPTLTDERLTDEQFNATLVQPTAQVPDPAVDEAAAPVEQSTPQPPPTAAIPIEGIERFEVEILEVFPHDDNAWTQGLELDAGVLVESTGQRGRSDLRRVEVGSGNVLTSVPAPRDLFAEGVTRVDDRFIQLTWRAERAFVWDADTFEPLDEFRYNGEGWGICYDGSRLVMSNGTADLVFRDPTTFEEISRVQVTMDGFARDRLNELECIDGAVWANVWTTDEIVRIDPNTGEVTGTVDASILEQPRPLNNEGVLNTGAVLNGIAWDAQSKTFLLTGKLWGSLYRVRFVPASSS